jgi:uncharacterized protein YjiS (DUF1127 family)
MSTADLFVSHDAGSTHRARRNDVRTVDLIVLAWRLVMHWTDRARQRRVLAERDDRLLADAGLTRKQVAEEVRKPFWH